MSDERNERERSPAEILKHRIVGDTGSKIATVAEAMFDAFTGGHEAVLDAVARDFEEKKRGGVGVPMAKRYRCTGCRGVHTEGEGCDAELDEHAPPTKHRTADAPHSTDTERAPAILVEAYELELACAACLNDRDEPTLTTFGDFGAGELATCERCHMPQAKGVRAFRVRRKVRTK